MGFGRVRYFNFRNISNCEVEFVAPQIFLIGENAQGKTNIIESIYFLCYGSSFRTKKPTRIIRSGCDTALLEGIFNDEEETREIEVKFGINGMKDIRLDSKRVMDRKEMVRRNPCLVFSHGDMEYVVGPPERRRWFFNQTISLYDPLYIDLLRQYKKVLKSRNLILRAGKRELIDVYDNRVAILGLEIQAKRRTTVNEFFSTFRRVSENVSGTEKRIRIVYQPSWKDADHPEKVLRQLASQRDRDISMGMTTTGPHRDNIAFLNEERDFATFASIGQIRLLSLILKVAQADYFSSKTSKRPILLLDDVLLELDTKKKEAFLRNLPEYNQIFFTFLPHEKMIGFPEKETLYLTIREGNLSRWRERAIS